MDNYVFISYAHKDKKEVANSIAALASCGVRYWYDGGIEAGADWAEKVSTKLEEAAAMVLFLSKHSVKSKNVLREIQFANDHNIRILTVQLYKFKLPAKIEKLLTVNQFAVLNSFKTYKEFAESFLSGLSSFGVIGEDRPEYVDKKIHISGRRTAGLIILAILFLAIIVIAGIKILIKQIPTVIGMETNPAEDHVVESGFDCAVANGYSDDEEYGYIFDQNKYGNGLKNSTVVITQSLGPEVDLVNVPNVVGYHVSEGIAKLVEAGMKSFVLSPVETKEYEIAYIAKQSITPNVKASALNKIVLDVSSDKDTIIEIYGTKIQLTDRKVEVDVTADKKVVVTPLMVFSISTDYKETDPINAEGTINATSNFLINVKREDANYYGKYRGRFVMQTEVTGDDSLAWKLANGIYGDKSGKITIQVRSESFNCKAEEYDDAKYKAFVAEVTGSSSNALDYTDPIMMILGKNIVLTDMNGAAKNLDWLYKIASKVVFSIPKLNGDILEQPYSIIVQKNGKVYVALYGRDGEQKAMEFHGNIQYE